MYFGKSFNEKELFQMSVPLIVAIGSGSKEVDGNYVRIAATMDGVPKYFRTAIGIHTPSYSSPLFVLSNHAYLFLLNFLFF